ncbi:MAG TPA: hypothetical protein VN238_18180 [Solirubrobacteraceae bacterium]|nr:hypothetical protein [Solirubrobacteraceae bacterium]
MNDLNWFRLTPRTAREHPGILDLIAAFEPLDHPAGRRAAEFLRDDALRNHGSTVTHLLVGPKRIEGFIALNFTDVKLHEQQSSELGVPHRRELPALKLAWIAKHRETEISGMALVFAAYLRAFTALTLGGVVALVLDPFDGDVAATWSGEPYAFRLSKEKPRGDGVPRGLWLPVRRSADD